MTRSKAPGPSFPARWRKAFRNTAHGVSTDGLTPASVAVGLLLSEYADWETGGSIRPGHDRLSRTVGISRATVKRCVAALIRAGWIALDDRGSFGRASTYRLEIPPLVVITTGEIQPPVTGSPVSPLGEVAATRNGLTGAHITGSLVSHHLEKTFALAGAVAA